MKSAIIVVALFVAGLGGCTKSDPETAPSTDGQTAPTTEAQSAPKLTAPTDTPPAISSGNPAMYGLGGIREEGTGFPVIFNIEADPREENNVLGTSAWVIGPYLKVIGEYQKTLEKYPNPKPVRLTEFGK